MRNNLVDFEGSSGIKILHKSRDGRKKKSGQGVALAFDMGSCNFRIRHLKQMRKDFEVLCAMGRVAKIDRVVVVFVVYIPPSTGSAELETLKEQLADNKRPHNCCQW